MFTDNLLSQTGEPNIVCSSVMSARAALLNLVWLGIPRHLQVDFVFSLLHELLSVIEFRRASNVL